MTLFYVNFTMQHKYSLVINKVLDKLRTLLPDKDINYFKSYRVIFLSNTYLESYNHQKEIKGDKYEY